MRRIKEDNLIRYAFGDLDGAEAQQAAELVKTDPNAAKAVEGYRQLRAELRQLSDVPQGQISSEMLRDRILTQGLKPGRIRLGWTWSLAPVAAVAFALVLLLKAQPATDPEIRIDRDAVASTLPKPELKVAMKDPDSKFIAPSVMKTQPEAKKGPVFARNVAKRSADSPTADKAPVLVASKLGMDSLKVESMGSGASANATSMDFGPDPETSSVAPATDSGVPESSIVLIMPETDGGTGANRATEVNSSNVVIGG